MNDSRIVPVFQILAEDMYSLGIRTVFGLMSDDTAVLAMTLDGLGGTRTTPSPWLRAMPTPLESWASPSSVVVRPRPTGFTPP
jgi:hypothetical protein